MPHPGYLHLPKAFLRCCISLWKGSGPVQTGMALWVRVTMTLYLAERLWWLSHCKYWSVWAGLQYTVTDKELSASCLIKVSRKGIDPFSWLLSAVNLIAWFYIINMTQEQFFLGLLLKDKGVIHKPKPIPKGVEADCMASLSKCSIYRLATIWLTGDPIAAPSTCS